jgi:hypothetical protein
MPLQQVPNDQIISSGTAATPVAAIILPTQDTNTGSISVAGASCGDRFVAAFKFRPRVVCVCGKPQRTELPPVYKFIDGCNDIDFMFSANVEAIEVTKVWEGEAAGTPPVDPQTAAAIVWPGFVGETHDVLFSYGAQDLNNGC